MSENIIERILQLLSLFLEQLVFLIGSTSLVLLKVEEATIYRCISGYQPRLSPNLWYVWLIYTSKHLNIRHSNICTWASSPEGGFWWFSRIFCITTTDNKTPLFRATQERKWRFWTLGQAPLLHTTWFFRTSSSLRQRICSATYEYISALWVSCTFCCATISMGFHA